jgi:hypothetical protein
MQPTWIHAADPFGSFVQGLDAALALKRMKLDQNRQDLAQQYREQQLDEKQYAIESQNQRAAAVLEEAKRKNEEWYQSATDRLNERTQNDAEKAAAQNALIDEKRRNDQAIEAIRQKSESDRATAAHQLEAAKDEAQRWREQFETRNEDRLENAPLLKDNLSQQAAIRKSLQTETDPAKRADLLAQLTALGRKQQDLAGQPTAAPQQMDTNPAMMMQPSLTQPPAPQGMISNGTVLPSNSAAAALQQSTPSALPVQPAAAALAPQPQNPINALQGSKSLRYDPASGNFIPAQLTPGQ